VLCLVKQAAKGKINGKISNHLKTHKIRQSIAIDSLPHHFSSNALRILIHRNVPTVTELQHIRPTMTESNLGRLTETHGN
jgi:hypothetical protein